MMTVFPELVESRLSLWNNAQDSINISNVSTHIGFANFGQLDYKVYETPVMRVVACVDLTRMNAGNTPGFGWKKVYCEPEWPREIHRWNRFYSKVGSMYMLGAFLYPDMMEMLSYVSDYNRRDLQVRNLQDQLIGQASYGAIVWNGGVP